METLEPISGEVLTPAQVKPVVEEAAGPEAEAKKFIYFKESGDDPGAVNSTGCRGLGQACPGSKLPCGVDYACQDAWFTNYMKDRYGTWQVAKAHWLARVPINGVDVGNWW